MLSPRKIKDWRDPIPTLDVGWVLQDPSSPLATPKYHPSTFPIHLCTLEPVQLP